MSTLRRPAFWVGQIWYASPVLAILVFNHLENLFRQKNDTINTYAFLSAVSCTVIAYVCVWFTTPYLSKRHVAIYTFITGTLICIFILFFAVLLAQIRWAAYASSWKNPEFGQYGYFLWKDVFNRLQSIESLFFMVWIFIHCAYIFVLIKYKIDLSASLFSRSISKNDLRKIRLKIGYAIPILLFCLISVWLIGRPQRGSIASTSEEILVPWSMSNEEKTHFDSYGYCSICRIQFSIPKGASVSIDSGISIFEKSGNLLLRINLGDFGFPKISPFANDVKIVQDNKIFHHAFLWNFNRYHHVVNISTIPRSHEDIYVSYSLSEKAKAALADKIIETISMSHDN